MHGVVRLSQLSISTLPVSVLQLTLGLFPLSVLPLLVLRIELWALCMSKQTFYPLSYPATFSLPLVPGSCHPTFFSMNSFASGSLGKWNQTELVVLWLAYVTWRGVVHPYWSMSHSSFLLKAD